MQDKEIPLGIELVFSSSLKTEAVGSTVAVREANSNHGPVTLSLSCTVYFIHSEHTQCKMNGTSDVPIAVKIHIYESVHWKVVAPHKAQWTQQLCGSMRAGYCCC